MGLWGLDCWNGQEQRKAPRSGPAPPRLSPAGPARPLGLGPGPWDPGTQAPRRRKATLPLPRRPRSEDRMWGDTVGATRGREVCWPTSCFRPSESPEGTWRPRWAVDEGGQEGGAPRRDAGTPVTPPRPLSGPSSHQRGLREPAHQGPVGRMLALPEALPPSHPTQGRGGTMFLFVPHPPECQRPRHAQHLTRESPHPQGPADSPGGIPPALDPRDPLLRAGPRGDPAHLRPPRAHSGRVQARSFAPRTAALLSSPQIPVPALPCVPGPRGPRGLKPSPHPRLPPKRPGHQACARPQHAVAVSPLSRGSASPQASGPAVPSAGHQARAPAES